MSDCTAIFDELDRAMTAQCLAVLESPQIQTTASVRQPLPRGLWQKGLQDLHAAWQAAQTLKPLYRVAWGKDAGGYYVTAPGHHPDSPAAPDPVGEPDTLASVYDVLRYCAPPHELLEYLQCEEQRAPLPPAITGYLRKWERVLTDQTIPPLDSFHPVRGDGVDIVDLVATG